ncbi:FecR domain-containing protein [Flavobacteriaceae bacterium TP-CH-4]|uniref:FecR domain-containing protein n=1 Tax=Pelagihabitans pacificus TaxID=2696054 RepID=A0A967E626_9FLAO|nr:FecR family protein [Pelagihabitans pacificus]NHF59190.1 FecR domain-containing protein [Pelagihabitans pacificus]
MNLRNLSIGFLWGMLLFASSCSDDGVEVQTQDNFEATTLPDGSLILVNHYTLLSYDENFTPRKVTLEGEAFFEVAKGESDFVVSTKNGTVWVKGTEFNVKTAADQLEVDVKSGWVKLKTEFDENEVKNGMKAVYKEGENAVRTVKSDQEYRKWTRALKKEFKKIGKEIQPVAKQIGKEFKKAGKTVGKELRKLKD